MQRMRKSMGSLRKVSNRLWMCFLLFYSVVMFILFVVGTPAPSLLILPFFVFVPGYAFVVVVFPELRKPEKVVISIGFSVAFIVGIKSFIITFAITGVFSELTVLTIFSAVCLIVRLIK